MTQDLLVIAILIGTIIFVLYRFTRSLRKSKQKSGCSGGCQGCSLSKNSCSETESAKAKYNHCC